MDQQQPWWRSAAIDFIAGTIGGFSGKVIEFPFDTLKVRLQTDGQRIGFFKFGKNMLVKEGFKSFYRGLPLPLAGTMVETACLFSSIGRLRELLYAEKSSLSSFESGVVGGLGGGCVAFVLTPVELIKCRMQSNLTGQRYKGTVDCIRKSIVHEGYRVLYKGHTWTMLREVPGTACWYVTYNTVCRKLHEKFPNSKDDASWIVVIAGGCSGLSYNLAFYPADTIKTTIQTSDHKNVKVRKVVFDMYQRYGIKGFYRGLIPTLLRAMPANASVFYAYEMISTTLEDHM